LFEGERRLPKFQHDEAFYYLAFRSLTSALEQVHCHANNDLNLIMIGCHMFVDDGRSILGCFGLTTIKNKRDDSIIMAQHRGLYFAAPENIDYVKERRGYVGPPGHI
jgi:hypothetical protein